MKLLSFIGLTVLIALSVGEKVSYKGYKLLNVIPREPEHIDLLKRFEYNDPEFDMWGGIKGLNEPVSVFLSPAGFQKYKSIFENEYIDYSVMVENYQVILDQEERTLAKNKNLKSIIFRYARYNEMMSFIDDVVDANPDITSSYVAGTTTERRQIKVLVINVNPQVPKKAHWLDCGVHAREWVAPATCIYIIDQILKEYKANDPVTVGLLNKYEIHIMPLANPDGYEFAHTSNRLWRKNRRPNPGSTCVGTDVNRNFDHRWRTGGSSTLPCSDTYAGPSANSELETQAIVNSIEKKPANQWESYFSLHIYGLWWLLPFGYSTATDRPVDYDAMVRVAQVGAEATKAFNGSEFVIGTSAELLYVNTGSSKDWAYGEKNIKYSYVLELRPGNGTPDAVFGFVLPEDRLVLACPETWLGIKAAWNEISVNP